MNEALPDKIAGSSLVSPAELYRMQVREMRRYAMFTISPEGILTSWNAGVQDLLGYSESEWVGQHACLIFSPPEKAEEICNAEMRKASEDGDVTDIRWHRHKGGAEFFANGFLSALRDSNGTLVGYSKIMSDETARKNLQDSLTESNTALEQFAYAASHDLQEPLRTMSAYAQLLSRQYSGKLDGEADRMLEFVVGASTRMTTLVRDLLEYARFTTEQNRPASAAIDEDLEAALSHLDEAIQASGAVVTHDPMPVLQVDRGQIVRLFQNLIGNAIKYRKPNRPSEVHISAEQKGADWVFTVRDNGMGFDQADAAKIFEPFKRLHSAADIPGTGVGLAICRRIVNAQGGRIWAESQPGQGASFYFTLPA
jgi:PAS domain S-box-containing protein